MAVMARNLLAIHANAMQIQPEVRNGRYLSKEALSTSKNFLSQDKLFNKSFFSMLFWEGPGDT